MKKSLLIILDGYGEGEENEYNAVANANTPFLKGLKADSHALIKTDGEAVGIFKGELGGSEVGHTTIGAGRIIKSTVKQIHDDVKTGEFRNNKVLQEVKNTLQKSGGCLHLCGMMSDMNVHSNINHAYEIIDLLSPTTKHIFLHLYTDGRDTSPYDSLKYIKQVKNKIKKYQNCEIASIGGRGYAMDREDNLDRTEIAFNAMFKADKAIELKEIENYLKTQHRAGNNDQFVIPTHIKTKEDLKLTNKDVLFLFNFREDRVRQMAKMCKERLKCQLVTMSSVGVVKSKVLYPAPKVNHTLSEYLSNLGLKQIKISESTKYAHVTYFLNGGREEPFPNEDRKHIISHKVIDFATTPKMRANEIVNEVIKATDENYDNIVVNFSNPDMLGHTGNYQATVEALEYLDKCVKKVVNHAKKLGYIILLTADHGNAETMRTKDGLPHMAHTLNRVFCVVLDNTHQYQLKRFGGLCDIAPTILDMMEIKPYKYFEGKSLIVKK